MERGEGEGRQAEEKQRKARGKCKFTRGGVYGAVCEYSGFYRVLQRDGLEDEGKKEENMYIVLHIQQTRTKSKNGVG